MSNSTLTHSTVAAGAAAAGPPGEPCLLVIFGASGDLTRRLLTPALYNLACDGLLPERFAVAGVAIDELSTEQFRARLSADIRRFTTRPTLDPGVWDDLARRLHYLPGDFAAPATYPRLAELLVRLDVEHQVGGNLLFYLATPPAVFGLICEQLARAGFNRRDRGWTRVIVEKPFGHDLDSARDLSRRLLADWSEEQIYRIDHYLGKETVQNLLTFRFANELFEPLWNREHVDHIQLTAAETVGVEGRGGYYDRTGVLRDMIQNHLLQMLAYLCMEPPASFRPDPIRDAKARLLQAVRVYRPDEVPGHAVRGQYGPGKKADGTAAVGYRQEPGVAPGSRTESFAAVRLFVDNPRWQGVPVYLRSGKSLWKRGTEIIIEFKCAPDTRFQGTPLAGLPEANRLIFHMQPDQGIEFRFHAKAPGPALALQKVNMRFDYRENFEAPRGTGYEVLLYSALRGDMTLFSRTDLVESAWRIVQPILDAWAGAVQAEHPTYPAGSWGPKAAFDLLDQDGRRWVEVINRDVLEKVGLFHGGDPVLLHNLAMTLRPAVCPEGAAIIRKGEIGSEMYFICRGEVEVVDDGGTVLRALGEGDFFGEIALLRSRPRTASVRARTPCDLFVLSKADFDRILKDFPQFAGSVRDAARRRYGVDPGAGR
jgi:glucose-6-phosphate 1-dehydrogenase